MNTTSVWLQPTAQRQQTDWSDAWNDKLQRYLIRQLLNDPEAFKQCRHVLKDDLFDNQLSRGVRFILKHYDQTGVLPDRTLIDAKAGADIHNSIDLPESNEAVERDWLLTQVEEFARYKTIENTVLDAIDLLRQGKHVEIEERIRDANRISITNKFQRFPRLTADDFANMDFPDWLIPDLLYEKQTGMMWGPSGCFKSFIAIALHRCFHMAWNGRADRLLNNG